MANVCCSGAVVSSLFFELIQSSKIQEGFLLGKIEKVISQNISDNDMCTESTQYTISISSFYPLAGLGTFYSGSCKINEVHLRTFLGKSFENVVGWYRYRCSCSELYLKEMKITEKLKEIMSHTDGYFAFAAISGISSGLTGTMDISYRFSIISDSAFQPIPVVVTNMKDTSTSHYISTQSGSPLYSSITLKNILTNLKIFEPAVKDIEKMHLNLLAEMKDLLPKVATLQEKSRERVSELNLLKALCYSKGIIPEYQQKQEDPPPIEDLMDFESCSPSPKVKTRRATSAKSTGELTKRKNPTREGKKFQNKSNRNSMDMDSSVTDLINKESQLVDVPSPKSTASDENSNTLPNQKTQSPKTTKRTSVRLKAQSDQRSHIPTMNKSPNKDKENRVARSSSCDSSPHKFRKAPTNMSPIKSIPDSNNSPAYKGKMKSARVQNRSLDRSSPIHSMRHRSPSKTSKDLK